MTRDQALQLMHEAEVCRRLADDTYDARGHRALIAMAEELESIAAKALGTDGAPSDRR